MTSPQELEQAVRDMVEAIIEGSRHMPVDLEVLVLRGLVNQLGAYAENVQALILREQSKG